LFMAFTKRAGNTRNHSFLQPEPLDAFRKGWVLRNCTRA
jgi:hypothetical protein